MFDVEALGESSTPVGVRSARREVDREDRLCDLAWSLDDGPLTVWKGASAEMDGGSKGPFVLGEVGKTASRFHMLSSGERRAEPDVGLAISSLRSIKSPSGGAVM